MGKKTVGKMKYGSEKDERNDVNGLNEIQGVNDMHSRVGDGHQSSNKDESKNKRKHELSGSAIEYEGENVKVYVDVGDVKEMQKDKKNKKRKLQLDSTEKFQKDRKKDERTKDDGEVNGVGNEKAGKRDKKNKKRQLELDSTEEFQKDRKKDKRTKDDAEASEVGNEKGKKKDRKKDKRTKDDAEASEVGNDKEKKKDKRTKGDAEASEVGNEKEKKKDKKNMKDISDGKASEVKEVSNDTHTREVEKARKKGKGSKSDVEANEVSEASLDDLKNGMKNIDLQSSDLEEKNSKKKKKCSDDFGVRLQENVAEKLTNESCGMEDFNFIEDGSHANSTRNKSLDIETEVNDDNVGDRNKSKKKKDKPVKKGSDGKAHQKGQRTNVSENSTLQETPKKVSFSDQVEVFPSSDGPSDVQNGDKEGLVRGKRFSPEEDEMIKKAVFDYIEQHGLGEEGVEVILHCKDHKEHKHCWKDIAKALPWRPYQSVYYRGHVLFERGEKREWSTEEYEIIRRYHEKHGSDWRTLADALGKHRFHVKDTWRRIKLPNVKTGNWSQEEYQTLFDLVNMDLRMKAFEVKKSKHGMLRDNICWSAISDKLSTRSNGICCRKWYSQLTSPMVAEGEWADTDDYRLLDALLNLDACSMEDVDWDNLVENRSGDTCRKRWSQMVNHLGHLGTKPFTEQVEVLSKRYCVDVLEPREAYDSQPADP